MRRAIAPNCFRALANIAALVVSLFATANLGICRSQTVNQGANFPFIFRADFPLDEYAGLMAELGQTQGELIRVLGLPQPREPVNVVLFRDEASYRSFGQKHLPSLPYRRALFVKTSGPGTVYAFRGPELPIDLRHEATHGILHATLSMVPLWLDEGLAEYFEVAPEQRASGNPHHGALKWYLRLGRAPNLARLETRQDLADMSAADYRDAWAWVHFMLHGPAEAHDELVRFLGDIRAGAPPGQLSRRLEARLPGVERRLVAHFKAWPH